MQLQSRNNRTPNVENLFKIKTHWMAEAEITLSCSCCTTQIAGLNSRSISSSDSNKTRECKSHVHHTDTKFSYNSQEVQANKEIHYLFKEKYEFETN